MYGRTETALVLVKAGADTSIRNNEGMTFIQLARSNKRHEFAGYFEREMGAITRQQDEAQSRQREAEKQRLKQEDERAFMAAENSGTADAWSVYLDTEPTGPHRTEALKNLAGLLLKAGDTALTARMVKKYPGLTDHLPLKYSLAFIGPPGLTVSEVLEIKKQGLSDRLIAAQIRSTGAAYKQFSLKEIMELKKMGLSDEVIEAMIDATTKAREAEAQADYMRKLEALNAQQRIELEQLKLKMDQMQSGGQTSPASYSGGGSGQGESNCVAQAGAVELCKQTSGGLLQSVCISAAKAKFPCN
jgi:hypothetical protein